MKNSEPIREHISSPTPKRSTNTQKGKQKWWWFNHPSLEHNEDMEVETINPEVAPTFQQGTKVIVRQNNQISLKWRLLVAAFKGIENQDSHSWLPAFEKVKHYYG